jgi:hypothetical protein
VATFCGGIFILFTVSSPPECTNHCEGLASPPGGPYQDMAAFLLFAVSYVPTLPNMRAPINSLIAVWLFSQRPLTSFSVS